MKLIGLTGGIASGKSLLMAMFRRASIPIIDADDLAREVTRPHSQGYADVVAQFGTQIVLADGTLDRKALARLIFADTNARTKLEAIVHPLIAAAMQTRIVQLESQGHAVAVYCAPLIFEKRIEGLFDAVILVCCNEDVQVSRLMLRDNLSESEARLRLGAQMPLDEKSKRTPYQIDNNHTPEQTAQQLKRLWRELTGSTVDFSP